MSKKSAVVFVGPVPPPVAGMHMVNADMIGRLKELTKVYTINTSPGSVNRGLRYHLRKTSRAIRGLASFVGYRFKGVNTVYASVDDRWGGLWNMMFIAIARLTGMNITLHHHSYYYIVHPTMIMRMMVALAGPSALHVTLCDEMTEGFGQLYPRAKHFFSAPNSVASPPVRGLAPSVREHGLTLGLLSNLTEEKGLFDFITIFERLLASGVAQNAILAGPVDPGVLERLNQKLSEHGDRIKWVGPVSGETKEAFFENIDVFVFPTRYRTESFGLVLLEALMRGVPVIAPERGCVCVFRQVEQALIVPLDQDFSNAAIAHLAVLGGRKLSSQEKSLIRKSCSLQGAALNARHLARQAELAKAIARPTMDAEKAIQIDTRVGS
jgi:glycosyltransferase involved in cell wall biosynthesis